MYYTSELVPAKFLILVAHFVVCILLLWNSPSSVKACLPPETSSDIYHTHHTQLVVGLSIAIGMLCLELFVFLIGLTMFNTSSALLSISCHSISCILLTYIIFDGWQCGWFWWIFTLGSIVPLINDIFIIADILMNKKY